MKCITLCCAVKRILSCKIILCVYVLNLCWCLLSYGLFLKVVCKRTTVKEPCMDPFKHWWKPKSPFWHLLFVHIKNKPPSQQTLSIYLYMRISARNTKELQAGYLVTNSIRTTHYSIHLYTNFCVLASFVTFYDAKPQLIKTPGEGKLNAISPNYTCQCSLQILSYNISPSHFPLPLIYTVFSSFIVLLLSSSSIGAIKWCDQGDPLHVSAYMLAYHINMPGYNIFVNCFFWYDLPT